MDVNNGVWFEIYVIVGLRDLGVICLNGVIVWCVLVGDKVIIMNYV